VSKSKNPAPKKQTKITGPNKKNTDQNLDEDHETNDTLRFTEHINSNDKGEDLFKESMDSRILLTDPDQLGDSTHLNNSLMNKTTDKKFRIHKIPASKN
jgi:hypothetical protein